MCIRDSSSPSVWFWIIGLVVISTVLPYVFYTRGLTQVDSGRASIIASFEPVVATLSGAILFGEPIGILTVIGILCVLTGVDVYKRQVFICMIAQFSRRHQPPTNS